jgi:predicted Ser/Thr protein kinase
MVASGGGHASLIGATLGNYVVQALLGRGAVGTVYLAMDKSLGRPVALKVLLGSLARNPEQVRRFQREAKAAAPLQHPNIVSIYEAGIRGGTPFIAMEYVEGESLERFLRRARGPLPWQHALHVAEQVAEALDCAHAAGIVHRDIKPANILLDSQGQVRLTDFGIASSVQGEAKWGQTELGRLLGTPEYMSPEQCLGEKEITPASDLFSLGVMLYQMLSGKLPFEGQSAVGLMQSITTDTPPRLPQVVSGLPDDVARLVAHLMEKDTERRPTSARAVVEMVQRLRRENGGGSALPEALSAFIRDAAGPRPGKGDTPASGKKTGRVPRIQTPARRMRIAPVSLWGQLIAACLVISMLCGAGYWRYVRPHQISSPAPVFEDLAFSRQSNGLVLAPLPSGIWSVKHLRWAGAQPVLLVEVEGPANTLYEGARGVLAMDPENETIRSVRAPSSPLIDAEFWRMGLPGGGLEALPSMPENTPWHDAMPLQGRADPGHAPQTAVAQRWHESAPRLVPLFATGPETWPPQHGAPWEASEAGGLVLKPDGFTACLLLDAPGPGGNYLAEHDARAPDRTHTAPRLTSPGAPILPGTVQYSPDGSRLAYMRRKNSQEQELWVVAADGSETDGKPLAVGKFEGRAVFSPESDRVAVAQSGANGAQLLLLRIGDSEVEAEPGPGKISPESWHPSGQYLVVAAPDASTGQDQLWAVETDPPYRRRAITRFAEGVLEGGAVARDGRWVATVSDTAQGQVLVFVNLNTVLFAA